MSHVSGEKIKDVERALIQGELDEARGLLLADIQARRLPAGEILAERIAERFAQRAESHFSRGDTSAAWRDLNGARELSPEAKVLQQSRDKVVAAALDQVEQLLRDNNAEAALAKLDRLHQRNVAGGRAAILRQVALKVRRAERLRKVGKFDEAASNWKAAQKLREDMNIFEEFATLCRKQSSEGKGLIDQLQEAMQAQDWPNAIEAADRLLELAPQHPTAREARDQAWQQSAAVMSESQLRKRTASWRRGQRDQAKKDEAQAAAVNGRCENRRFQLWIDAVGGYLVCLGSELTIGHAVPGAEVDIPIFGNLERQHATLRRDAEGYLIVPDEEVHVEGRLLDGPRFLTDGDEIQLGDSVRLRFRKPHPLSPSATLEFVSSHRTHPASDAVLLMAESLVLGRKMNSHVVCRDWEQQIILFRQDNELFCRGDHEFEIDGELQQGEGRIGTTSRVRGRDFSLSVEQI